jgi:hypothetical protein
MLAMKNRGEQPNGLEDARALAHRPRPAANDSNGAFLRALADALRDILRDERTAA